MTFRPTTIPSKLVQVELEVQVDREKNLGRVTFSAILWLPREPRPYIGMPQHIADRWWLVARVPEQAKRGTLSPESMAAPPDVVVSEENRQRRLARQAAGGRKAWANRRRKLAGRAVPAG